MNQRYKSHNLIVVFDGADSDYVEVRNKVVGLDFDQVLCTPSNNNGVAHSIPARRQHIANIHNQIKDLLDDSDWIFSIEDDGIIPDDALWSLAAIAKSHKDAGMVSGVELGRWGVPYVGAWKVDDINNVKNIESLENKAGQEVIEEIDACGLYCALIRADMYKQHHFWVDNGMGADVNLGLFLRQKGFKNYIDWAIPVTHLTNNQGNEIEIPATSEASMVKLRLLSGSTWQAYR